MNQTITNIMMPDDEYDRRMEALSIEILAMTAASYSSLRTEKIVGILTHYLALYGTGLEYSGVLAHGKMEEITAKALHEAFDRLREKHPLSTTRKKGSA